MNEKKIRVYKKVLDKIYSSKKIALVSHKNPDLDTVGSATGFYQIIIDNFFGKQVDLICCDIISEKFLFLPNANKYIQRMNPNNYDLIIFLDTSSKSQSGYYESHPEIFNTTCFLSLNIDHHLTNEIYATQNIVNTLCSSTTMILYEWAGYLSLKISPPTATCFLAGIYSDTGGFKHSNVTSQTFFFSSLLLKAGADKNGIVKNIFGRNKLSTLKLWGKIIGESFIDKDGVLQAYVNESWLQSYNTHYDDISGVIDYLNMAEGIKYCTLLSQKGDYIKASLRTLRDDIDLTEISKKFDGGGHKKSSGFTTLGSIMQEKILYLKT